MTPDMRRVFAHLTQEHADSYRAILEAFASAREKFVIHLRPAEILPSLAAHAGCSLTEDELTARLQQLVDWGNLERTPDRMEAATVEEFYRARFLYQLSAAGEAAESALRHFEEILHRPGELQTAALRDIIEFLGAIEGLLADPGEDLPKLHAEFKGMFDRFEELTQRAQTFMRNLQSTIDLHGISVPDFLDYKNRLLDYLENFLSELVLASSEISRRILSLKVGAQTFDRLAEQTLTDSLDATDALRAQTRARWEGKWAGFRGWFLGTATGVSQAEILRRRARESIPALLYTVQTINDRRVSRSDRLADWQALALWFAEAPSETDAHRLWRSAFAMAPARHLLINQETLDRRDQLDETPHTRWLDAEPIRVSPRLQVSGRTAGRGGPGRVVDTSKERELLAALAARESEQMETARQCLARPDPLWLSDFEPLDPRAFDLLLDLLGEAMSARLDPDTPVETASTDGSLLIRLEAFSTDRQARIQTRSGVIIGPDARVTIQTN